MTIAQKKKRSQSGFTLIEIAIIIAVVAILGAVGATRFANMTADAHKTATYNALSNVRSALAIAVAKHPNDAITTTILQDYLDPPGSVGAGNGTKFAWTVNSTVYDVYYTVDGGSISGISKIVNTTAGNIEAQ